MYSNTMAIPDLENSDPLKEIEPQTELEADYPLGSQGIKQYFLGIVLFVLGIIFFRGGAYSTDFKYLVIGVVFIYYFCFELVIGIRKFTIQGNCLVIKYWLPRNKKIYFQDILSAFVRNVGKSGIYDLENKNARILCTLVHFEGNIKIKLSYLKDSAKLIKTIIVRSNLKLVNGSKDFVTYSI